MLWAVTLNQAYVYEHSISFHGDHIDVQIARFLVQQSLHTLKRRKHKSDLVQLHVQLQGLFVISIHRKNIHRMGAVPQKNMVAGLSPCHLNS